MFIRSSFLLLIIRAILLLSLLIATSSSSSSSIISAALTITTPDPSHTIVSGWDQDKFVWPNTEENTYKINNRGSTKKVKFTNYLTFSDVTGSNLDYFRLNSFTEKDAEFKDNNKFAVMNITRCSIGIFYVSASLKNVEINVFDNEIASFTVGKNKVTDDYSKLLLENVTIRIFNNKFLQSRFTEDLPRSTLFDDMKSSTGVFLEGSGDYFKHDKDELAPSGKCESCIGLGNGTSVSIHDNFFYQEQYPDFGRKSNCIIRMYEVMILGHVQEIAIERNKFVMLNFTNDYMQIISLDTPVLPTIGVDTFFNDTLFTEIYNEEAAAGRPSSGIRSFRIDNNELNLTYSCIENDSSYKLYPITIYTSSTRSVGVLSISHNNIIIRGDPSLIFMKDDVRAIWLYQVYNDSSASDPHNLRVCHMANVGSIVIEWNTLTFEPAHGLWQSFAKYWPDNFPDKDDSMKKVNAFGGFVNNSALYDKSRPFQNVGNLPLVVYKEIIFFRMTSACELDGGWHNVSLFSFSNNIIKSPVYTRWLKMVDLHRNDASSNPVAGAILNISNNRVEDITIVDYGPFILLSKGFDSNLQILVNDNHFDSPDVYDVTWSMMAINFNLEGGNPDVWNRLRTKVGNDISRPDFFAYCDNCSMEFTRNFIRMGASQSVVGINFQGEDRTIGASAVTEDTFKNFPQLGNTRFLRISNNIMQLNCSNSNVPSATMFETQTEEKNLNVAGVCVFNSMRNVSLLDISENNISITGTSANMINGVLHIWPGMFDAGGPVVISNNTIRLWNLWKNQITWLMNGIARLDYAPQKNMNDTIISGNDIEVHVGENGCSGMPCCGIFISFGNESHNSGDFIVEQNRVVMSNDKVPEELLGGSGRRGMGSARGVLFAGISFTSFNATINAFLIPQNLIFTAKAMLNNIKSIQILDNFINVSGVAYTRAIDLAFAGDLTYTPSTLNPKLNMVDYTALRIEGNELIVSTASSPKYGFSTSNTAIWIGQVLSSAYVSQRGFEFNVPMLSNYKYGSTINFAASLSSFRNNNITLRGGVPSVIAIDADVVFRQKRSVATVSATTIVDFSGTTVDSQVSISGRFDFDALFKGYYSEPTPPNGLLGFNKGFLYVMNRVDDRKQQSASTGINLNFVADDGSSTSATHLLFRSCNMKFETRVPGADASGIFWWRNSPVVSSTSSSAPSDVSIIFSNTSLQVMQSAIASSQSASTTTTTTSPTSGNFITPSISTESPLKASPLLVGYASASTNQQQQQENGGISNSNIASSDHQLRSVQVLDNSSLDLVVPAELSSGQPRYVESVPVLFLLNGKIPPSRSSSLIFKNSFASLSFDSRNFQQPGLIKTVSKQFLFSLLDISSLRNFSFVGSEFSFQQFQPSASNNGITVLPAKTPRIDATFSSSSSSSPSFASTWSLLSLSKSSIQSSDQGIFINVTNISISFPASTSEGTAQGESWTRVIPPETGSVLPSSLLKELSFYSSCVEIDDSLLRPSSLFYTPLTRISSAKEKEILVCHGKTATKTLSQSISEVPVCAAYGLKYVGDRRFSVLQTTGKRIQLSVGVIVGSDLLPLVSYAPTPQRMIPATPPPVGQYQSESFTHFRAAINASGAVPKVQQSKNSKEGASAPKPLIYSTNSKATVYYGSVAQNSPSILTLHLHIAAGLSSDEDHQIEIAFSPSLLACVTPPYDKKMYDAAKQQQKGESGDPFAFGDFATYRPKPIFYDPENGWPVLRFTLHKRFRATSNIDISATMKQVGTGFAFGGAIMSRNGLALSHMNRAETMYRFLDCGFSDDEPLDPLQAPIQIGFGTVESGYYQRAAILGNFVVVLIAFTTLFLYGFAKWKKRWRSYEKKMRIFKNNLLEKRIFRQKAVLDLKRGDGGQSRTGSSSKKQEKDKQPETFEQLREAVAAAHEENKRKQSLLSFSEPVPPPSLRDTLYSVCLPSHINIPLLGLLQGTVTSAVALLRMREGKGNDSFFAIVTLVLVTAFFVWVCCMLLYVLPRHRYVAYIERREVEKQKQGERRHVYGPAKWFPKCPRCVPQSVIVEGEDMSKQHKRRIVPRVRMDRFMAYRLVKWFLTPWGDWVLFRTPVKPDIDAENKKKKKKKELEQRDHDDDAASSAAGSMRRKRRGRASSSERRNENDDNDDEQASLAGSFASGRKSVSPKRNKQQQSQLPPHYSPSPHRPLEKHQIPDRFFRERTDNILDDYNGRGGNHAAIVEWVVAGATAIAAGLTPETDDTTDEACANTATFAMVVNVLPLVYIIAVHPYRKKTTAFFAFSTGIVLTLMSLIIGISKILDIQALSQWMATVQLGLDFAVTMKFSVDMIEMFWLMETETMLIPLFFLRHYLFHFGSAWRGVKAAFAGKKYRTEFTAKYQALLLKRKRMSTSVAGGDPSELLKDEENKNKNQQQQNKKFNLLEQMNEVEDYDDEDVVIDFGGGDDDLLTEVSRAGTDITTTSTDYRRFVRNRRGRRQNSDGCWDVPSNSELGSRSNSNNRYAFRTSSVGNTSSSLMFALTQDGRNQQSSGSGSGSGNRYHSASSGSKSTP